MQWNIFLGVLKEKVKLSIITLYPTFLKFNGVMKTFSDKQ